MLDIVAKVFAVILAGIAIAKSYVDFRARVESLQMFVFWLLTWTMILLVALFPAIVATLISSFGSGRTGLGTFFGMAIVFLFFVVYRIYVKLEKIDQNLTKAIQELALKDHWTDRR